MSASGAGTNGKQFDDAAPRGDAGDELAPDDRDPDGLNDPAPGRRLSRRALTLAWIGIGAAVAIAGWLAVENYRANPIDASVLGFDVTSAEQIVVDVEVSMPINSSATCTVEALSETFAQVGTLTVDLGPYPERTTHHRVTVATSELATTGIINNCRPHS